MKAGESAAPERATEPAPEPVAAALSPGPVCPSCQKTNHPGVVRCVFCGAGFSGVSRTGRWIEGPESGSAPGDGDRASELEVGTRARPSFGSYDDIGQPVADPLIGVVVADRYRILEGLGRGGMGIVYKVEHTRIGKLLAMKLLTGELSRNPEVVRRFKHEALTVSKLSSPNTVQVFDFGVSDGLTYLVMELVAGEDLGRVLRAGGPMPFGRLGKIMIQVCNSLAEAHQKQIVHRDIKPENIMLIRARDGTDLAKVLDFGLAKIREGSDLNDVTSQGAIVGTPYFMSPEQVRGEPVDPRSDIYALGALMYRALTGHYPFNGPTPMAVFTKHLTEMPAPPHARVPELSIPKRVSEIVMRALAKNPADRWQRVEDLQAALVEEAGTSSVEHLLDSDALRKLAKVAAVQPDPSSTGAAVANPEIATRDEVERYERKLRRQRYGLVAFAAVLGVGALGGAAHHLLKPRQPRFEGLELEPNNVASEATQVPVGRTVTGYIGKRLDATKSDRDFFAFDVSSPFVSIQVTSLPNMALCAMLYQAGQQTALGQYCVGRPGRDLNVGPLRVTPGRYLVALMQDRDPYGGTAPFVHENVSDTYALFVSPVTPDPAREIEPNDQVASANAIAPGTSISGALGWSRDEDVVCADAPADAPVQWKVTDVVRDAGSVLEVTPLSGTTEGAAVRVHVGGKGTVTATDVPSPWTSAPISADGDPRRCIRLRLVFDPWTGDRAVVPSGASESYLVELSAPK